MYVVAITNAELNEIEERLDGFDFNSIYIDEDNEEFPVRILVDDYGEIDLP